ncbi:MAG TPA: hypothetical protein VJ798_05080 [Rhizomicrobium sp.]|nr:hypothetical protein [Rhizomicrobium sp.]
MNALTPLAAHGKSSFRAACKTAHAIGKASDSAHLRRDQQETPHEAPKQRPRLVVELVSQVETKGHDPFRDAPRLAPIFVTQLLGQVMDQERNRLVRTPYGIRGEKSARLFDTRF